MKKYLERFIFIGIIITLFTPLVFVPGEFIFPFVVPKILFFRTMTLLLLGAYVCLIIVNRKKYLPKKTPVTIAVSLFILSFIISTFLGFDWYRSFWDSHERMLGLFTIFHYFIFYIICTSVMSTWKDWRWIFRFFLLSGIIVMIIGILQKINPNLLANRGADRVSATMGNAIYFGAYGAFIFFISTLLFLQDKKNTKWRIFSMIAGVLGIIGVFISGTRGVFLGLIAGYASLFMIYLFFAKHNSFIKKIVIYSSIIFCIFLGSIIIFRNTQVVKEIPTIRYFVSANWLSGTGGTRLLAWQVAFDGWVDKPILGWGPNNYYYAFNKYYRPEFLEHGPSETWFDNAHNAMLNVLTTQGIPGAITYLGLFAVPIYSLFVLFKKKKIDIHTFAIPSAFLVFHIAQQFFVFENPTSYLYLFLFLAFINAKYIETSYAKEEVSKKDTVVNGSDLSFGSAVIVFVCIGITIFVTNVQPARANMATMQVLISVHNNSDVISAYKNASSIPTPHIDDVRMDFARSVINAFRVYAANGATEKALEMFRLAYTELQKNRELHPFDIRVHIQQLQLAQMAASVNNDLGLLLDARNIILDAINNSPKRQQLYYSFAGLEMQLNQPDRAIIALKKTIELDPKISEGWWRQALIYKYTGKPELARQVVQQALEKGVIFAGEGKDVVQEFLPTSNNIDS